MIFKELVNIWSGERASLGIVDDRNAHHRGIALVFPKNQICEEKIAVLGPINELDAFNGTPTCTFDHNAIILLFV